MSSVVTEAAPISVQAVFTSPKYSDLTVFCDRDKYLLHRAIVCPRSKFFDAACDGGFKEASTATITLDGDDPQTINRMLIYLYTNDYPEGAIPSNQQPDRTISTTQQSPSDYEVSKLPHLCRRTPSIPATSAGSVPSEAATPAESTSSPSQMMSNVLVYAIADKYDLSDLKLLARERVQVLARKFSSYTMTADFPEVARVVFDSTPATDCGLRDIIVELCSRSIDDIMKDGDALMIDTIQDVGPLSFGILLKTREAYKLGLERAKTSEAITHQYLAHSKAENRSNVMRMLRLEDEIKQSFAAKTTAINQLGEALGQKQSSVAQIKQLKVERNEATTKWNGAVTAQKLAISQLTFAINQTNQAIVERDAALNQASNCLVRLDFFLAGVQKWKECRNCGLEFDSWLERIGPNDGNFEIQLRCSDCRCRHDLGAGVQ